MKRILLFLISLLGFSMVGCDKPDPEPKPSSFVSAYGTPRAKFEVKGRVVDENQQPLNHIQITAGHAENIVYTDSVGVYQIEAYAMTSLGRPSPSVPRRTATFSFDLIFSSSTEVESSVNAIATVL